MRKIKIRKEENYHLSVAVSATIKENQNIESEKQDSA